MSSCCNEGFSRSLIEIIDEGIKEHVEGITLLENLIEKSTHCPVI